MLLRLARRYGTMISAIGVENWPIKTESIIKHLITELTEILFFGLFTNTPIVSRTTQILAKSTMKLVTQSSLERLLCAS